jgi:hypothetical protein
MVGPLDQRSGTQPGISHFSSLAAPSLLCSNSSGP